ncbi:MAG: type VI secretion system protein TssA [bacterium]
MIDRERLLAPLPGDHPTGPDLRAIAGDGSLREIEDFRREEDPALDPDGRGKEADWPAVARVCQKVLGEKSKDLQVAAHLTEALARTQGFAGVLDGFAVVRGLLDRYWADLHPGVDEGQVIPALRARWISWLGSSRDFLAAVKSIPLTSGPGVPARSWRNYEDAQRVDSAAMQTDKKAYEEMIKSGLIPVSEWKAAVAATPTERLRAVVDAIAACEEEVRLLTAFCDERFVEDAPNLVELSNLLGECRDHLGARLQGTAEVEASEGPADAAAGAPGGGSRGSGPIASRDDAFRRLREAADFLRRTEPHSPVPYLVDRAVSWGEMPFRDVLRDVLKDEKAFKNILETLGMSD